MSYNVSLTQAALNDLYTINEYYLVQISDKVAANILKNIQATIQNLADFPERGTVSAELSITRNTRYR